MEKRKRKSRLDDWKCVAVWQDGTPIDFKNAADVEKLNATQEKAMSAIGYKKELAAVTA